MTNREKFSELNDIYNIGDNAKINFRYILNRFRFKITMKFVPEGLNNMKITNEKQSRSFPIVRSIILLLYLLY